VPTLAEAGFPDIKGDAWMGVFVPAGTSRDIIALLNREIVKIVRLSDIKERTARFGAELRPRILIDRKNFAEAFFS
jgi:tripartite-type tricarboxylate transporter receptor subunit TctC